MHRHDFPCLHHLFCTGDIPEQAVLWGPHGPLWALNHEQAEDVKGSLCPSQGGGGLEGRSQPVAGGIRPAEHKLPGQALPLRPGALGCAVRRRSAAAGGRLVPSAALPSARLCGAGTDGPGPQKVLQKLQ